MRPQSRAKRSRESACLSANSIGQVQQWMCWCLWSYEIRRVECRRDRNASTVRLSSCNRSSCIDWIWHADFVFSRHSRSIGCRFHGMVIYSWTSGNSFSHFSSRVFLHNRKTRHRLDVSLRGAAGRKKIESTRNLMHLVRLFSSDKRKLLFLYFATHTHISVQYDSILTWNNIHLHHAAYVRVCIYNTYSRIDLICMCIYTYTI